MAGTVLRGNGSTHRSFPRAPRNDTSEGGSVDPVDVDHSPDRPRPHQRSPILLRDRPRTATEHSRPCRGPVHDRIQWQGVSIEGGSLLTPGHAGGELHLRGGASVAVSQAPGRRRRRCYLSVRPGAWVKRTSPGHHLRLFAVGLAWLFESCDGIAGDEHRELELGWKPGRARVIESGR